jgi:hypothetical protein
MRPLHWSTWQLYDLLECVSTSSADVGGSWQVGTIYDLVKKSDTTIWVRQGKHTQWCKTPGKRFKFFARPKLDEAGLRRLYMRED